MCRLFGLLGGGPTPALPWLVSSERSLLAQSNVSPEVAQADGWGLAWYDARGLARTVIGTGGAYAAEERPRYVEAAGQATSPVVLGHLRHASNPMNLPRARLIGPENCQPFLDGRTMFVHNGMVPLPRETRPLLRTYESRIKGVNDSEVLFWLLQRNLGEVADPAAAFGQSVAQLVRVWEEHGRPGEGPYSGLNVILTRGPSELWAFCQYAGDHGSSFLDPARPYYELAYQADARQVVVGSEPFDNRRDTWRSLPNGHYLHARSDHGLVTVQTAPIPAAAKLAAA
jgi:predicted glutamine amidotransferase